MCITFYIRILSNLSFQVHLMSFRRDCNVTGVILRPATITTKGGNPYVAVLISWALVQVS